MKTEFMKIYYTKNKIIRFYETNDENEITERKSQMKKQMFARSCQDKQIENERRDERNQGFCKHCFCLLPKSGICNCQ